MNAMKRIAPAGSIAAKMTEHAQQRVDYDAIAHLYDEPVRDYDADPNLIRFVEERPHLEPAPLLVLDLGCGTGKQLAANRKRFPEMSLVGLDLFRGMLRQARQRCETIDWVQGDGAAMPFRGNCFHYITNQFSYHHVRGKEKLIAEIYRLLRAGGRFAMTNLDPWAMADWIVYRYFPAARACDYRDFWPTEVFARRLEGAGFVNIRVTRRHQTEEQSLDQFLAYARQRFRTSQLMVIPDDDYDAGIREIERDIGKAGDARSEICIVTVTGDRPA
jgi:ubiquinone/menaquinone biosynthesis C-methylase UbiE